MELTPTLNKIDYLIVGVSSLFLAIVFCVPQVFFWLKLKKDLPVFLPFVVYGIGAGSLGMYSLNITKELYIRNLILAVSGVETFVAVIIIYAILGFREKIKKNREE